MAVGSDFDAIWQFEILGRKFEQIEHPLKVGVLQSQKSYFLVFYKAGKVAIMLWRGRDQTMITFKSSVQLFKQTKFRLVKKGLRAKGVRSQSNVDDVNKFMAKKTMSASDPPSLEAMGHSSSLPPLSTTLDILGLDLSATKRKSGADDGRGPQLHNKFVFRPIDQVQQTVDPRKLKKEQALNLDPFKRDEHVTEINLRSLVLMDHEPMYFLQAFQGSCIVTTNEYLTREPQVLEGEEHFDEQYVMMF